MGRFYGEVGYGKDEETSPGVWTKVITPRMYYGDIIKTASKTRESENLNDNLYIENRFSLIADPFAYENFHTMQYIKWMGTLWKITSVEVRRPRLIISIGGVYNEQNQKT